MAADAVGSTSAIEFCGRFLSTPTPAAAEPERFSSDDKRF